MNDDQIHDTIHDLFARVADDPAPPLGFSADGIAGEGRRGARTRRAATVGGATAGVVALGFAVAALPGFGASGRAESPASTGGAVTTSATTTVDPVCAADTAKFFPDSLNAPQKKVALELCPALRSLDAILDPTGKHLAEVDGQLKPINPDIVWGVGMRDGKALTTGATLCYNGHGLASTSKQANCAELPEVGISVTFGEAGAFDPSPMADDMTLADRKPGVGSGSVPWIEKSKTVLPDGSTVTVSEVRNGDRVEMKARRVQKSGESLTIVAGIGYDSTSAVEKQGSVFAPFPFTATQLTAAASVGFTMPDLAASLTGGGGIGAPSPTHTTS